MSESLTLRAVEDDEDENCPPIQQHSIQAPKWLVRVPLEVCTLWDKQNAGDIVGTISVGSDEQMTLSVKLKEENESGDVWREELEDGQLASPLTSVGDEKKYNPGSSAVDEDVFHKYSMSEYGTSLQKNMMVMTSTSDEQHSVVGKVVKKFKAFPVRGEEYSEFLRRKNENSKRKRLPIKLKKSVVCFKPVSNHQTNIVNEKKKKSERRYRMDREELTQKLFELFETHQYYTFKSLLELTKQPSSFLKETLKEYCNFNAQGLNRTCWELKPEYRHYENKEDDI